MNACFLGPKQRKRDGSASGGLSESRASAARIVTPSCFPLLDLLVTQAVLSQYRTLHHGLSPQIAAFLRNWGPPNEL